MMHCASDLHYRLYDGTPPLDPLRVLDSRTVAWRDWQVRFCVLAASHAVCLIGPDGALTEILACAGPTKDYPILVTVPADRPVETCAAAHGLTCRARLFPDSLCDDRLAGEFHPHERLHAAYPARSVEPTPMTRIGWHLQAGSLVVETLHTYPEENRTVRSRTVFTREAI